MNSLSWHRQGGGVRRHSRRPWSKSLVSEVVVLPKPFTGGGGGGGGGAAAAAAAAAAAVAAA